MILAKKCRKTHAEEFPNAWVPLANNIAKSINYFSKAANNNCATAQIKLGFIYLWNMYIERDIGKEIHYQQIMHFQVHKVL